MGTENGTSGEREPDEMSSAKPAARVGRQAAHPQQAPAPGRKATFRLQQIAWLPILLLLLLTVFLHDLPGEILPGGLKLLSMLNLLFSTLVSLLVAVLAASSFFSDGSSVMPLLGCGALAFGIGSLLAGIGITEGRLEAGAATFYLGAFSSGLYNLAAGLHLRFRLAFPQRRFLPVWQALLTPYSSVLLLMTAVLLAVQAGLLPAFLTERVSPTWLRQLVLGATIIEFAASAGLLIMNGHRGRSAFLRGYGWGLALIAVGLWGAFGARSFASPLAWIGRIAQYLGAVYLLTAVAVKVRRSGGRMIPMETLRETHQRYTRLVDTSPDGIVVVLVDGLLVFANPAAARLVGARSPQELIGRNAWDLVSPEDRPNAIEQLRRLSDSIEPGSSVVARLRRLDGLYVPVEGVGVRVDHEGRQAVQVILRDISKRRRAEEALLGSERKFRSLVENASDGVVLTDEQGTIIEWNPAQEAITGLPRSAALGQPLWEVQCRTAYRDADAPPDIERVRFLIKYMLATGQISAAVQGIERAIRRADGERRILQSMTYSIPTNSGYRLGGIIRDVTEHRRTEEALRELNTTLEQKVAERTAQLQALAVQLIEAEEHERRRIGEFLHDDLQQVLASGKMRLKMLEGDVGCGRPAEAGIRRVGKLLDEAIQRCRLLSQELVPPAIYHADLPAVSERLAQQMKEKHGLEVQVDAGEWRGLEEVPVRVFLFRSIQELLFNVVKHAGVSAARVRLSSRPEHLEVEVADAGKGFDPAASLWTGGRGTGFGLLSICERARSLGGSLEVDSAPGRGSRFTITIPLKESMRAYRLTIPPAQGEPLGPPGGQRRPPKTIRIRLLLADDHRVLREGLRSILESRPDLQVVGEAADGEEAVELTLSLRPDVVVMDLSMPRLDGVEATRRIKEKLPEVRVIGLSMYEPTLVAQRLREAGAEAVFSKAGRIEDLLEAIRGERGRQGG